MDKYCIDVIDLRCMIKEKVDEVFADKKIAEAVYDKISEIEHNKMCKPLVCCKHCRNSRQEVRGFDVGNCLWCTELDIEVTDDWFCAWGESKYGNRNNI